MRISLNRFVASFYSIFGKSNYKTNTLAILDLLLGGILAYGLIRGIWNGFFAELASFISLLVGIFIAIKFSHITKAIIAPHVSWNPTTIQVVAFFVTFILVVIAITVIAKLLTSVATFAGLGIFNKLLGGLFGVLKMTLILSISLNLFAKINSAETFAKNENLNKSLFYNPIRKTAAFIYPSLEEWFEDLKKETTSTP